MFLLFIPQQQHYMESNVPCVVVASKVDLPEVKQLHGMTPAEFCYKHRLPPPLPFSCLFLDSTSKNIYTKLAWAAVYPYVGDKITMNVIILKYIVKHVFIDLFIQTPEWFRHEQHIILAASGTGFSCGCRSGLCNLPSCCQTEMTNNQQSFISIKTKPDHNLSGLS